MAEKVLSLGQCGADNYAITQLVESNFDAEVIPVDTFAEAWAKLRSEPVDLILVNRILDADGASGLAFLGHLKKDPALASLPAMLVSNLPTAQQKAIALGALPGFGKAALRDPETMARLRGLLDPKKWQGSRASIHCQAGRASMSWYGKHPLLTRSEVRRVAPHGDCRECIYWLRLTNVAGDVPPSNDGLPPLWTLAMEC